MARKQQKINPLDDIDFDLEDAEDTADDSALDPIFDRFYTPDVPDDDADSDDETFIEAAEAENVQMLADLEKADHHQESLLANTRKATGSGVDTNYYFSVVFVSEEQCQAFFEASGWAEFGGTRFLNGVLMAKAMGIELPPGYLAVEAKPDKAMSEFIRKE